MSLVAWLSLGVQVQRADRQPRPAARSRDFIDGGARAAGRVAASTCRRSSWWFHSDGALTAGRRAGRRAVAARRCSAVARRLCFALSTLLYLSYVDGGARLPVVPVGQPAARVRLARRLPAAPTAPAPLVHFLFRLVLFKLYFESGIAKWQSPLRDWQDGSAMTYYYETAPLPTWLAWSRAPPAGLVAPLREPGDAGAGAGRPVRDLRPAPGAAVRASPRSRCSRSSTPRPPTTASSATWPSALHVFLLDDARRRARAGASRAPRVRAGGVRRSPRALASSAQLPRPRTPPDSGPAAPALAGVARRQRCSSLVSLADALLQLRRAGPGAVARARRCSSSTGASAS